MKISINIEPFLEDLLHKNKEVKKKAKKFRFKNVYKPKLCKPIFKTIN